MSEYCRDCERLSQDCDALSADNNKLTARVEELEVRLDDSVPMEAFVALEAQRDVIEASRIENFRLYAASEARCAALTAEVIHYTAGTPHPLEARVRELEAELKIQDDANDILTRRVTALEGSLGEIIVRHENDDSMMPIECAQHCRAAVGFKAETEVQSTAAPACTTCGMSGRGTGFCSNPFHLDYAP